MKMTRDLIPNYLKFNGSQTVREWAANKMKKILMVILFLILVLGAFAGLIFIKLNNDEKVARAQKCYEEGEALFKQKDYKKAMWKYEEVSVFYAKPHTIWLDLALEKEWVCRAYLNDWIPSDGPLDRDVRALQPDIYAKYKVELSQITPVPQVSNSEKKQ